MLGLGVRKCYNFNLLASLSRQNIRRISVPTTHSTIDVRKQLLSELKDAMKSKDTVKSTTIRSVLAEVYAADKAPGSDGAVSSSAILAILRKAVRRRADSAIEFEKANRADLALKEKQEAELLEVFLPALLSEAEIDRFIREIIAEQPQLTSEPNKKRAAGMLFKTFYSKVDRSLVDTDLVRSRADALLAEAS